MPNLPSAKKRMRSDRRKHRRNQAVESELKTLLKQFRTELVGRQMDQAKNTLHLLTKKFHRAAAKGIVHLNTASRRISRLAKALHAAPR